MEAIGVLAGILGGFAIVTGAFALVMGLVAASRLAPALWWSEHPWRGLWIMMLVLMVGAVLYGVGAATSGMIVLITALPGVYASAIWGLRVSWYRSRRKAVLIFVIVMGLLAATGLSRWIEHGREIRQLDQAVLTLIIGAVFWLVAAFIADSVYTRVVNRRRPSAISVDAQSK